MGLDSYFRHTGGEPVAVAFRGEKPPSLCGGMFSENGAAGSFRGKVYADLIQEITGVSIYQEEIENEVVREMAGKLEAAAGDRKWLLHENTWVQDLPALAQVFRAFADAGCNLYGWW